MSTTIKFKDCQLIVQQYVHRGRGRGRWHLGGGWDIIPTSRLTDPLQPGDWERLKPLRINVLADSKRKCGVATNVKEMRHLIREIVGVLGAVVPAKLRAKQDREGRQAPGLWDKPKPLALGGRPVKKQTTSKRLILPPSRSN